SIPPTCNAGIVQGNPTNGQLKTLLSVRMASTGSRLAPNMPTSSHIDDALRLVAPHRIASLRIIDGCRNYSRLGCSNRQDELEYRAPRRISGTPYPPAVSLHDGAADRQTQSHPIRFRPRTAR